MLKHRRFFSVSASCVAELNISRSKKPVIDLRSQRHMYNTVSEIIIVSTFGKPSA